MLILSMILFVILILIKNRNFTVNKTNYTSLPQFHPRVIYRIFRNIYYFSRYQKYFRSIHCMYTNYTIVLRITENIKHFLDRATLVVIFGDRSARGFFIRLLRVEFARKFPTNSMNR